MQLDGEVARAGRVTRDSRNRIRERAGAQRGPRRTREERVATRGKKKGKKREGKKIGTDRMYVGEYSDWPVVRTVSASPECHFFRRGQATLTGCVDFLPINIFFSPSLFVSPPRRPGASHALTFPSPALFPGGKMHNGMRGARNPKTRGTCAASSKRRVHRSLKSTSPSEQATVARLTRGRSEGCSSGNRVDLLAISIGVT